MEPPKKIRKLRTPSLDYQYAVLSKETTKDWVKDTELDKIFDNLQSAIDYINQKIKWYIDDYELQEEFENNIPTVSIADIPENAFRHGEPFQIINVKSPTDECNDPEEDGMWGNLRIYIQRMRRSE